MRKETWEGNQITIFYDDGSGKCRRKDGICSAFTDHFIEIEFTYIIPMSRVYRIERGVKP